METPMASLQVNESLLKEIVQKEIQAGIMRQLGNVDGIISGLVATALKQQVNDKGFVSSYSYENKHDLITVLCREAIHNFAREAILKVFEKNREKIVKEFEKQILKGSPELARDFVSSLVGHVENRYRFSFNMQLQKSC